MTTGRMGEETLAAPCAAVHANHIGFSARFVNEDQPFQPDVTRFAPPPTATASYVGALLLIGVQRFFYADTPDV